MQSRCKGLRVKYCENLGRYDIGKSIKLVATSRDGWYIQTWYCGQWRALMDLCFARERDALAGAHALTLAGLSNHNALNRADPLTVKQVACEMLQW